MSDTADTAEDTGTNPEPVGDEVRPKTPYDKPTDTGKEPGSEEDPEKKAEGAGDSTDDATKDGDDKTPDSAAIKVEDLTLPEGMEIAEQDLGALNEVLKSLDDLSPKDRAQKLVDLEAERVVRYVTAQQEAFETWSQSEIERTQADKEIGGDKLEASLVAAQSVVLHLLGAEGKANEATKALFAELDRTGLGNNRELLTLFVRVSKAMQVKEGKSVDETAGPSDPRLPHQIIYPSMTRS